MFASEIRRKPVQCMRQFTHWRWHLDETYVTINGLMHYLRCRAVPCRAELSDRLDLATPSGRLRKALVRLRIGLRWPAVH